MVKVINVVDNGYWVEHRLRATGINDGEFIGGIKVMDGWDIVYGSEGEHAWYDLLEYGKAIIDNGQEWEEYDMYIGGRKYTLREIIQSREVYDEVVWRLRESEERWYIDTMEKE